MSNKTPAQLEADIREELDKERIAEWKRRGGNKQADTSWHSDRELMYAFDRQRRRDAARKREAKKGKLTNVTDLNLSALADVVVGYGGHVRFPNALQATDKPHIKRCIDGGYVTIEGKQLALTATGKSAVADYLIADLERQGQYPATDPYYIKRQMERVEKFEKALDTLTSEKT